jgi:hypothetical protein
MINIRIMSTGSIEGVLSSDKTVQLGIHPGKVENDSNVADRVVARNGVFKTE